MMSYKHSQRANILLIALGMAALVLTVVGLTVHSYAFYGVLVIVAMCLMFHSLTIEIRDGMLQWRFGIGIVRKKVSLQLIASAQPVRTAIREGWGIHWSRYGLLYNVSGLDAVAITLHNGKRFALGTDEPKVLAAQLQQIIASQPQQVIR